MKSLQETINSLSHEELEFHKDLIEECLIREEQLRSSRVLERLNFLSGVKNERKIGDDKKN